MKIAIATDNGNTVSANADQCREFRIYETPETRQPGQIHEPLKVVANLSDHHHGQGPHQDSDYEHRHYGEQQLHSHGTLSQKLNGVEVLLCKSCGPKLIADLKEKGITVLGVKGRKINRIVSDFFSGTAETYEAPNCKIHQGF